MSIFDRLRGPPRLETKASSTEDKIWVNRRHAPNYSPRVYESYSRIGYGQNPIVYACVNKLAEAVARLPLTLYQDRTKRREIENHPMHDLFSRPSPRSTWAEFARASVSYYRITGNAFFERVIVQGRPAEIYSLRPDRMRIVSPQSGVFTYRYEVNGQHVEWTTDYDKALTPIWHWKNFHPTDDYWGMGALDPSVRDVDLFNAYQDENKGLLDNLATPSGAFRYNPKDGGQTGTGQMPQTMFENLKKMLDNRDMTGKKRGRPLLLEGGLEWQQFGLSPQDMQYVEGQREASRRIALAFGVPPMVLGIPGDNTYSNLIEANEDFYRSSVMPLAQEFCDTLTQWLSPAFGDPDSNMYLTFDEDEIPALSASRERKWSMVVNADWLTTNEKRRATGYENLRDGNSRDEHDKVMAPANKAPIGFRPDGDEADGDEADTGLDVEIEPPKKPNGRLNGVEGNA